MSIPEEGGAPRESGGKGRIAEGPADAIAAGLGRPG